MKKLTIVIILIGTLTLTACSNKLSTKSSKKPLTNKESVIKSNGKSHQKYTIAPSVNLSNLTEEQKNFLQESLDKLGDVQNDSIKIISIGIPSFDEKGTLCVTIFVRNGLEHEVFNLKSRIAINVDGKTIAASDFLFDTKKFGYLPSKMSRPFTIRFNTESVKEKDVNFENKMIELINMTEYEER